MKKVLITGGAGYKGCVLVPKLLAAGYAVVVYDLMLFGADGLPSHPRLQVIKGDIRDLSAYTAALRRVTEAQVSATDSVQAAQAGVDIAVAQRDAAKAAQRPSRLTSPRRAWPRRKPRSTKPHSSPRSTAHWQS